MSAPTHPADAILAFWFDEIEPKHWWARSDDFDRLIATRFAAVHGAATRTPWTWVVEDGRLVRREVTLGLRGSGSLEVRSGLEPGTAVALPGEVVQSAGQRVRSAAQEL